MAKEEAMIKAQKEESQKKIKYAKEVVDIMVEEGEIVTPYTVWKKSKLSKGFIYTNEEVKTYIEQFRSEKKYNYRKYTIEDVLEQRVEDLEKENAYLRKKLKQLQSQTIEDLITQNQVLQKRLSMYDDLVKQGIIKLPEE